MTNITRKQRGFSLIELLIVIGIILVIAAIAIPDLMKARLSAQEAAAVGSLRTISTAEAGYVGAYPGTGYAPTLANLGTGGATPCVPTSATACMIDETLASASSAPGKGSYIFTATGTKGDFLVTATPIVTTGKMKSFCEVTDNIPRFDPNGAAITSITSCMALNTLN